MARLLNAPTCLKHQAALSVAYGAGLRVAEVSTLKVADVDSELGGHVEACEDCGQWRVAYNSCRNRHCPKCQGAAARSWLAEREADLLPVGYFHVVFTLPAKSLT